MIEDTALKARDRDRLGFGEMARHLASSFLQNDLSRGFVVGVEGAWGSGKSSLVNLALEELSQQTGGPRVVRFAPWLVGNRNELLAQLFSELEPVILESVPATEREETKAILGRYAQVSSGLAAVADLAEIGGLPWARIAANFFRKTGGKAADLSENSLGELNEDLRKKLKNLNHPIIVFVDDLDRLEPKEAAEVLRLVKAVADFPNVAYVLAYDVEVLAKSIERAIGISNGRAYLEKVVQASFKVPKAMSFDLRNWLKSEVLELLDGLEMSSEVADRLESVFHQWCGQFVETPRDVVRVLNSLKLNFMPVRGQVDPGDMVFLQMVRVKNNALFDWIESYVSDLSAIGDWGHITPGSHERMGASLLAAIEREGEELTRFIFALEEHLPGFDTHSLVKEDDDFKVFSLSGAEELRQLAEAQRLASPNHYSYYFSFSAPSGSVSDTELDQFLSACEAEPKKALVRFRQMIEIQRPQGGRLAEVLLDRILGARASISASQIQGLFWILGESLDELAPFAKTDYGRPEFLQGNRREVFGLIDRVADPDLRLDTLRTLFSDGKSIAWLVGIIREVTFEHGDQADRRMLEDERLLSIEEFELIKGAFLKRLSKTSPSDLLRVPHFLSLMFAWRQVGDEEGALCWISQQTESESGFLNVLERMKSWSDSSSEGVQYKLRPETLKVFFGGVSTVHDRLKKISGDNSGQAGLRSRAEVLLGKFDGGP
ncbi:MAG: P-loop NTPase fold protein [Paracoccaceae bacterium]|uniref:KAP family P-loop NTPase fold protein n=1 Tax=Alphaproteobacteria TaxID=28211 RepID=UPI003296B4AE